MSKKRILKPINTSIQICADAYRILLGVAPFDGLANKNIGDPALSKSIERIYTPLTRSEARKIVDAEQMKALAEKSLRPEKWEPTNEG